MICYCDSEDRAPTEIGEMRFLQCCLLDFGRLRRTSFEASKWGVARTHLCLLAEAILQAQVSFAGAGKGCSQLTVWALCGWEVLSQTLVQNLFSFPFWMYLEVKEYCSSLWWRRGLKNFGSLRLWESALFSFPRGSWAEQELSLRDQGVLASLGFPFSATMYVSKWTLITVRETLKLFGKSVFNALSA